MKLDIFNDILPRTQLEPILEERLLLVTGASHALAERGSVRMAELAGVPLVLLNRQYSTRRLIDAYLEAAGCVATVACETNTIDLMLGLVSASGLAAIVPESAIEPADGIRVLSLVDPVPLRISAILWSRHKFRTVAAKTFAEIVRCRFIAGLPASAGGHRVSA